MVTRISLIRKAVLVCSVALVLASCSSGPDAAETSTTQQAPTTTERLNPVPATTRPGGDAVALDILVWDETVQNRPGDEAVLLVGTDVWTPDLEFGGDGHKFAGFDIGTPGTFSVYPDGPGGTEIKVSFVMTDEMISGSDMSKTNVEIHDNEVRVWGQAIPEFEQSYRR